MVRRGLYKAVSQGWLLVQHKPDKHMIASANNLSATPLVGGGERDWAYTYRQHFFTHQCDDQSTDTLTPTLRSVSTALLADWTPEQLRFALNPCCFHTDSIGNALHADSVSVTGDVGGGGLGLVDSQREPPVEAFGVSGLVFGCFASVGLASVHFQLEEAAIREACMGLCRFRGGELSCMSHTDDIKIYV